MNKLTVRLAMCRSLLGKLFLSWGGAQGIFTKTFTTWGLCLRKVFRVRSCNAIGIRGAPVRWPQETERKEPEAGAVSDNSV